MVYITGVQGEDDTIYYMLLFWYLQVLEICHKADVEEGTDGVVQPLDVLDKCTAVHTQGKSNLPE